MSGLTKAKVFNAPHILEGVIESGMTYGAYG